MHRRAVSFLVQAVLVAGAFAAPTGASARGPQADGADARHVHADGTVHVHEAGARPRTGDGERPGANGLEAGHSIHGGAPRLKALRPNGVSGVTNWVLLRCKYQGDWQEQPTNRARQFSKVSYFQTMFSNQTPGLGHYWNRTSYGKISINASFPGAASESDAAVGWRTLPQPNQAYGRIADPGGYVEIDSFDALTRDCAQVWDATIAFNANTYYAFVLDQSPGACGVGGSFDIGTRDGVSRVAATLIGPCHDDESLWAHEMGHAFGLPHSISRDSPTESWNNSYDTAYDVMSAPSGECGSWWGGNGNDPRTKRTMSYGCIPGQPLAYFKDRLLGWIPAHRAYRHPGGTRTITLERLATPGVNANHVYAEIPVSSTVYYTVEARLKTGLVVSGPAGSETITTGYDENIPGGLYPNGTQPAPGGVIVNKVSYIGGGFGGFWQVQLMGTDTNGDGYRNDEGTILKEIPVVNGKGEKWTDATGKVSVQVDSRSGNTFSVTVTGPTASGHRFYPLARTRVLDTRNGTGGRTGALGPNATMTFPVLGQGGIPSAAVAAVVLNLRSVNATAASSVTAYTSGTARPGVVNLQLLARRSSSNLVTVRPGSDGRVALYNRLGSTHLVADVIGYYGAPTGGLGYQPVYPALVWGTVFGSTTEVGANGTVDLQVSGRAAVPHTGVSAAALQVSVEQPAAPGAITVYATGAARPAWNDYAFSAGDYHTGMVISRLGPDGRVRLHNSSTSPVRVSLQILGWYGQGGALTFRPTVPARVMTTVGGAKLGGGATRVVDLTGVATIPANGARAVVTNVSALSPDAASSIRVRPVDEDHDYGGHDLTFRQTDANAVIAQVGASGPAGGVRVINLHAATHVAVDVFGWFGEPY